MYGILKVLINKKCIEHTVAIDKACFNLYRSENGRENSVAPEKSRIWNRKVKRLGRQAMELTSFKKHLLLWGVCTKWQNEWSLLEVLQKFMDGIKSTQSGYLMTMWDLDRAKENPSCFRLVYSSSLTSFDCGTCHALKTDTSGKAYCIIDLFRGTINRDITYKTCQRKQVNKKWKRLPLAHNKNHLAQPVQKLFDFKICRVRLS